MCLYPKIYTNKKYTPNKKNGGIVPAFKDIRTASVPVGCGKCIECKKQKARGWQVRLHEEIKNDPTGKMINFSFSDQSLIKIENHVKKENPELKGYKFENEVATQATRWFLERWRKKFGKSVKHWFVTELGQKNTERIHIHGIIWTTEKAETIDKIWGYGHTYISDKKNNGYVNAKTINYIVKYVNKIDQQHKYYESKILTSKGIGIGYLKKWDATTNKFNENGETNETYRTPQGIKLNLPTYYRNHIYSEEEREKLWIQKLDKNERWICGEKIDTSHTIKDYIQLLKYYRKKNDYLGYGNDKKNWNQRNYENQLRELKRENRHNPAEHIRKKELYVKLMTIEEAFDTEIPF